MHWLDSWYVPHISGMIVYNGFFTMTQETPKTLYVSHASSCHNCKGTCSIQASL